jgi:hypothetical protein
MSRILGVPSLARITQDLGLVDFRFYSTIPLVSPSPYLKLQQFSSPKGLKSGVCIFWKLCSVPSVPL